MILLNGVYNLQSKKSREEKLQTFNNVDPTPVP